jgi:predicted signal transduction protein with EAL and GGDEF domain
MATMLRTHTGTSLTGTCPDHGVRTFSRPWRSLSPADAADAQTLTKYADTAMYQAKRAGRDTFQFFTSAMNTEVLRRRALETALRQAVRNEEFVLYYQPKEQLSSGQVVGIEALLRWERPGHGLVQPSEFICALEDCGLIVDVGRWVITAACKQIRDWLRRGMDPVQVSVNVSERQFVKGDLHGDVLNALDAYGVPAELLELELTESLLMNNTDRTITLLQNLKAAGVQISIDVLAVREPAWVPARAPRLTARSGSCSRARTARLLAGRCSRERISLR